MPSYNKTLNPRRIVSEDLSSIENFNATKNREISIIYINGESLKLLFGVEKNYGMLKVT